MSKFYRGMKIFNHSGYEEVYFPDHPNASSIGNVFVHRLVAEEFLGRYLKPQECIHHVDEIKNHNIISNLWVFKTTADHTRYHTAIKNNLDFILRCTNGVYTCRILIPKEQYMCPNCKGRKSKYAKLCRSCSVQEINKGVRLDKVTLAKLLQTTNYTEIGRRYGMSGTGVKKIAKKYELYQKCFADCPNVERLIELLKTMDNTQVAKQFNVSTDTLQTWIKNNHICIKPLRYLCVETGDVFESQNEAARQMYPQIAYRAASRYIGRCCSSGDAYHGYHWKKLAKEVFIK